MEHRQQEKSRQDSKMPTRSSEPAASIREDTPTVFQLQQALGNQGVLRLLRSGALQAKLTVSHPNDIHEQEADRVADEVMRMTDEAVSNRQSAVGGGNGIIQTKPG